MSGASAIRRLVTIIEQEAGIEVPEHDLPRLEELIRDRVDALGCADEDEYVRLLQRREGGREMRGLVTRFTVKESYLFRGAQQLDALRSTVLPELVRRRQGRRVLLWSAGCARGEEAVSLAIVLASSGLFEHRSSWRVVGTDVDEEALATARRGVYAGRSVARIPPDLLSCYFSETPEGYRVSRELAEAIDYRAVNLVSMPLTLPHDRYDVIFLRNVLIYFPPAVQRRVVSAVAGRLAPDGSLFVGPSESLWQLDLPLEAHDLGDTFCYRRSAGGDPSSEDAGETPSARRLRRATEAAEAAGVEEGSDPSPVLTTASDRGGPTDDPVGWIVRGLAEAAAGRIEDSVTAYRAALYLDQDLFQVRCCLALCLAQLGSADRARREARRSLASAFEGGRAVLDSSVSELPSPDEVVLLCRNLLRELGER